VNDTRPQRKRTIKAHLEENWGGKCGQRASGSAAGRWKWQHRTQLDGDVAK